jgi:hypothetical protein
LGAAAFGIATLASLRSPQRGVQRKAKAFYRIEFTPPAQADVDVNLAHTDRVYDAATDRVFCLTEGSITPVNPATGVVEAPIVVTTSTTLSQMKLSSTGSQLFVSTTATRGWRRWI